MAANEAAEAAVVVVDDGAPSAQSGQSVDPDVLYGEDGMRIIVEDAPATPAPDPEREALLARLATTDQALARAQAAPVEAIAKGLEALSQRVGASAQESLPGQQPSETPEDFRKRYNEKAFEDPFGAAIELLERYKGSEDAVAVKRNLALSFQLVESNADDKAFLTKHRAEVEAEVARLPTDVRANDPSAVKRALRIVRADHLDEIIAESLAKVPAAAPQPSASRAPSAGAQFAESAAATATVSAAPKEIRLTSTQYAKVQAYCARMPVDEVTAIGILRRANQL